MTRLYLHALLRVLAGLILCATIAVGHAETRDFGGGLTLKKQGIGELRRFGFLIYEAELWAASNPTDPPIAFQLTYKRDIVGARIVDASISQMRTLGADEKKLVGWGNAMAKIFPDVRPGDQITGIYQSGGAAFYLNNRPIGEIRDPEFARRFFGIWLDPRTSEPQLREQLLGQRSG